MCQYPGNSYLVLSVEEYQKVKRVFRRVVSVKLSIVFHSCLSRCLHGGFIELPSVSAASDWPRRNVTSQ